MSRALDRGQQPIAPSALGTGTPGSGNFLRGDGAWEPVTNATNATNLTGTTTAAVPTSALATGTANSSSYLRGDRTWATIDLGGGAAVVNTPTTLTSSSVQLQKVNATFNGFPITLPSATTLTVGANKFVISNPTNFYVSIRDNSGKTISYVLPQSSVAVNLVANSTAAGDWTVDNGSEYGIKMDIRHNVDGYITGGVEVYNIDSDKFVVISRTPTTSSNRHIFATYYNSTTGEVSSPTLIKQIATTSFLGAVVYPVSSSQFLVVYFQGGSSNGFARLVNISGNTLSVQTEHTYSTSSSSIVASGSIGFGYDQTSRAKLPRFSNTFVVPFAAAGNLTLRAFQVSGNTVTSNVVTLSSAAYNAGVSVSAINATTGLAVWWNTSWQMRARAFTVSGTTITLGTEYTNGNAVWTNAENRFSFDPYTGSDGRTHVSQIISSGNTLEYVVFTVSGTTITANSTTTATAGTGTGANSRLVYLSDTEAIFFRKPVGSIVNVQAAKITISNGVPTVGTYSDTFLLEDSTNSDFNTIVTGAIDSANKRILMFLAQATKIAGARYFVFDYTAAIPTFVTSGQVSFGTTRSPNSPGENFPGHYNESITHSIGSVLFNNNKGTGTFCGSGFNPALVKISATGAPFTYYYIPFTVDNIYGFQSSQNPAWVSDGSKYAALFSYNSLALVEHV